MKVSLIYATGTDTLSESVHCLANLHLTNFEAANFASLGPLRIVSSGNNSS